MREHQDCCFSSSGFKYGRSFSKRNDEYNNILIIICERKDIYLTARLVIKLLRQFRMHNNIKHV
jgi:hypothetical protein